MQSSHRCTDEHQSTRMDSCEDRVPIALKDSLAHIAHVESLVLCPFQTALCCSVDVPIRSYHDSKFKSCSYH